MKKIALLVAFVVFISLSLSSCETYSPNQVLYVYNWGEYIDSSVNERFEKEYGIKVIYDEYDNNESMYAALKMGAANYDVVFPSDYMVARMIREGMLEPLNKENIPNLKSIDLGYFNEDFEQMPYDPDLEYSVPYMWGVIGLLYNSKYVEEEPTSWDVLWDSKYAGKTLMYNNYRDALGISLIKNGENVNTVDEEILVSAKDDVKNLKKNLQAFVSDEIFNLMESGSAYITPAYAGDAITMMEENPDLKCVIPEEGTNFYVDSMCIVKGSKNKEAAEKYINFLCREDIATLNRDEICYSTPHTGVYENLDSETKNDPIAYPKKDVLKLTQVYTDLPPEILDLCTDLWIEIKNH